MVRKKLQQLPKKHEARLTLARWYRSVRNKEGGHEKLRQLLVQDEEGVREIRHQILARAARRELEQAVVKSVLPPEQHARKPGRKRKPLWPLQKLLGDHPDWTNKQLADGYAALAGVTVSPRWVSANRNAQ
jgi:hypothetical protein